MICIFILPSNPIPSTLRTITWSQEKSKPLNITYITLNDLASTYLPKLILYHPLPPFLWPSPTDFPIVLILTRYSARPLQMLFFLLIMIFLSFFSQLIPTNPLVFSTKIISLKNSEHVKFHCYGCSQNCTFFFTQYCKPHKQREQVYVHICIFTDGHLTLSRNLINNFE